MVVVCDWLKCGFCCMNTLHSSAHEGLSLPFTSCDMSRGRNCSKIRVALTKIMVWTRTRGRVTATRPWGMSPQHFLVCEGAVILPQLHVPAALPCLISPECVHHKILSLLHVAATCPCKMSPRIQRPSARLKTLSSLLKSMKTD